MLCAGLVELMELEFGNPGVISFLYGRTSNPLAATGRVTMAKACLPLVTLSLDET